MTRISLKNPRFVEFATNQSRTDNPDTQSDRCRQKEGTDLFIRQLDALIYYRLGLLTILVETSLVMEGNNMFTEFPFR